MRKILFILVALAVAGSLVLLAVYRSGLPTTLEGLYDEYHARGVRMGIQSPFSGVVRVAQGGEVVFERAYGFTDPTRQEPLTLESRFLIGAGAKPITAALVLRQVEAGTLALDGTVSDYLPEFPADPGRRITLHHLLSHTAGLPRDAVAWDEVQLRSVPGERYDFSNFGYDLLVAILETATGAGYGDLVETGIVAPLGLAHTGFAAGDALAAEVATGMDFDEYPPPVALVTTGVGTFDEARPPAAAFYTSAGDLHRIVRALRDGELLSAEMTERMFTPNLAGYAYGWARNREWAMRVNPDAPLYSHVGRQGGYNAVVGLYDDGTTLIVLSNADPLDVATVLHETWLVAHGMAEVETELKHPSLSTPGNFQDGGGLEAFIAYYRTLSERAGYTIDPDPDFCEQAIRLAVRSEQFEEAAAFADTAIDSGWVGRGPEVLNTFGYVFLQYDRFDEARRYFERNIELHPTHANAYDSLGELHELRGEIEAARANYTRALEIARERNDSMANFYERRLAALDNP